MKRLLMTAAMVAAGFGVGLNSASAQDDAAEKRALKRQSAQETTAGSLDDKTSGTTIRASELIGMNIQNDQGESVGEINDLVLDAKSGKVRYAAVTYGGFLGVGNKLFAVPFEAFQTKQDPDDRDDHVLVLNVTQQQLEGATGFDEDHWPNFADQTLARELDERYKVQRNVRVREPGRVNVETPRIDVEVERE